MANINGVTGYNKGDGSINNLLVAYGNDILNPDTGLGYGLNLTSANNVEFERFIDRVFFENYSELPMDFNGTKWSSKQTSYMMTSKLLRKYSSKSRLFIGYLKFGGPQVPLDFQGNPITFPSRIAYCDLYTSNTLTWGMCWGTNGSTIGGTNVFQLTTTGGALIQDFVAANIKVGDPLFITNGDGQLVSKKPYQVASVDSPYKLLINGTFPITNTTNLHYWVGSNWVDIGTDDGDYLTALAENNDQFLAFKNFGLYRYNISALQKVKNVPGTTSTRSVVNIGDYTMYFHGSNANTRKTGIYVYNGYSSTVVSRAIQPFIDGIASTNYASCVGWREGSKYRVYVGTITNVPANINVANAVITWDSEGGQFSIDPIADVVKASGKYIETGAEKYFIGNDSGQIHETASGYSFNGTPISWAMETGNYFPSTTEVANRFTRAQVVSKNGAGVQILYKLAGKPMDDDDNWIPLGNIEHNYQEFVIPLDNNYGRGINIRFQDRDGKANTLIIKKIAFFYVPETSKIYEIFGQGT